MPSRTIQFHADPEEVVRLAEWLAEEFHPRIVGKEFPPPVQYEIAPGDLRKKLANPRLYGLAFVVRPGRKPSRGEQSDHNVEDAIMLQISRPVNNELRQSALGLVSPRPATMAVWKAVARRLRGMTRAGVTATNPDTDASAFYKDFRYTDGAEALARQGVVLRPSAGNTVITLGPSVVNRTKST